MSYNAIWKTVQYMNTLINYDKLVIFNGGNMKTNKIVLMKAADHAIRSYMDHEVDYSMGKIALKTDILTFKKAKRIANNYNAIYDFCKEGGILVYTEDKRRFLKEVFDESEEESRKYSPDKVEHTYNHILARGLLRVFGKDMED